MSDSLSTIIVVMAVCLIMFLVPFGFLINQNEVITENRVKSLTSIFVNTVAKEGKITKSNYNDFLQEIYATGNTYLIEVEVQILSNYPSESSSKHYLIGENMYYSEFTPTIEEKLENDGEYVLKKGDYIRVKVENTNITIGTKINELIYGITGNEYSVIDANISSIVEGVAPDEILVAQKPKVDVPIPITTDEPSTGLTDSEFIWKYDYWWKTPMDSPFVDNIYEAPDQDSSISNINIKPTMVLMRENGNLQGKGAAWAIVRVARNI